MSKLIDKLNKLSKPEPPPIGFRTVLEAPAKPKIQLIAAIAQEGAESLTDNLKGADAAILRISKLATASKSLQKLIKSIEIPWGGWLKECSPESIKQIEKLGVDFLVFPPTVPLTILQTTEIGKIIELDTNLPDGMVRTFNEIAVDAIIVPCEDPFFTCQNLMLLQRFSNSLSKPIITVIPPDITGGELTALWEAGINGVVAEADKIKDLRKLIDGLDFPTPRKGPKKDISQPRIGMTGRIQEEREEEGEEEEEDE